MKRNLKKIVFICLFLFCFSGTALGAVESESQTDVAGVPVVSAGWEKDGEDWRYKLSENKYLEREWIEDGGKWYYLDEDGYMLVGTQKIRGEYYYFRENGEMAVGWTYDDDTAEWYYMNEDGTRMTGWYQADGLWYWFDSKGVMFHQGSRMIDGHKYYFFGDGQMAANTYLGLYYYDADGLRQRQYDMVIQGKRKPTEEEKEAISKAMEGIPGEWMEKCVKSGWEFMFYTDKNYFSAPATDQGVYYIYHKTDVNYRKIKFTNPESLTLAFGEYVASVTGNDKDSSAFMVDFQQYLAGSTLLQPLPSYFDDKPETWFGMLFEAFCDQDIFYDIKKTNPDLAVFMVDTLGVTIKDRKPALEELRDKLYEVEGGASSGGPSTDDTLGKAKGPASASSPESEVEEQ